MIDPIPEENTSPLPHLNIAPTDLIDLARWHHFKETPDKAVVDRLIQTGVASPIVGGFNDEMNVLGVAIHDPAVKDQIENVPELDDWIFDIGVNRRPSLTEQSTSFTKLVHEWVPAGNDSARRFSVLTGTTAATSGESARLNKVDDPKPWA